MEATVTELPRTPVRDFIAKHKVAIAVTATAATCLVLNRIALSQHEDYMEERGILDDFYNQDPDEEI